MDYKNDLIVQKILYFLKKNELREREKKLKYENLDQINCIYPKLYSQIVNEMEMRLKYDIKCTNETGNKFEVKLRDYDNSGDKHFNIIIFGLLMDDIPANLLNNYKFTPNFGYYSYLSIQKRQNSSAIKKQKTDKNIRNFQNDKFLLLERLISSLNKREYISQKNRYNFENLGTLEYKKKLARFSNELEVWDKHNFTNNLEFTLSENKHDAIILYGNILENLDSKFSKKFIFDFYCLKSGNKSWEDEFIYKITVKRKPFTATMRINTNTNTNNNTNTKKITSSKTDSNQVPSTVSNQDLNQDSKIDSTADSSTDPKLDSDPIPINKNKFHLKRKILSLRRRK